MELNVTKNELDLFEKDLWKDARKLQTIKTGGKLLIRRFSDGVTSINSEIAFLQFLNEQNLTWKIPKVINYSNDFIEFEYLRGIRLFNFIIELRYLHLIEKSKKALELSERIKLILIEQLLDFQNITQPWCKNISEYYPFVEKCWTPIQIITNLLSFSTDRDEIFEDLKSIAEVFRSNADSLFRDATPKNSILNLPQLFYSNFKDDADRRITIRYLVDNDYFTDDLLRNNIYQFDFSGCIYLCPKIDDLVAINLHESTKWTNSSKIFYDSNANNQVFLATVFIRFMRFGGRKLAYRLLHQNGHKIRFRFDYEKYYFEKLYEVIQLMQKIKVIKGKSLLSIIKLFERATDIIPSQDYFKTDIDLSRYYSDILHI